MKKSEFKKIIKPIVKECIQETFFENGLLSSLIKEIVSGVVGAEMLTERRQTIPQQMMPQQQLVEQEQQNENWFTGRRRQPKDNSHAKDRLMNAIGRGAYGGVDIFEGTQPLRSGGSPSVGAGNIQEGASPDDPTVTMSNAMSRNNIDPSDPGADISWLANIMKNR